MKNLAIFLMLVSFLNLTFGVPLQPEENDTDIFEALGQIFNVQVHNNDDFINPNPFDLREDNTDECVEATSNMTQHLLDYPYNLIFLYSFKDVDDLGNYYSCTRDLNGIAQYYSMNINITNIPFVLTFGTCMPVQCSQTTMNVVANNVNEFIALAIDLLTRIPELEIIKSLGLGLGFSFVQPKESLIKIREGKAFPTIFVVCVFAIFFVLC